jgi:hypothetical protein
MKSNRYIVCENTASTARQPVKEPDTLSPWDARYDRSQDKTIKDPPDIIKIMAKFYKEIWGG